MASLAVHPSHLLIISSENRHISSTERLWCTFSEHHPIFPRAAGRGRIVRCAPKHTASSGRHKGANAQGAASVGGGVSSNSTGNASPDAKVSDAASLSANGSGNGGLAEVPIWEFTPEAVGTRATPAWAGDDPWAKIVTAVISFQPLFQLLKVGARNLVVSTAEKNGITWRARAAELQSNPAVYEALEQIEDKSIVYPSYYVQQFHAYEKGNLCWEAAFEVESATLAVAKRAFPKAESMQQANDMIRAGWLQAIRNEQVVHAPNVEVRRVLDVGCSAGISTFCLADAYPTAEVTGLDLSPYFLAVASVRQQQAEASGRRRERPIKWRHGFGEATGLPDNSFDLVSLAFVLHECPTQPIKDLIQEAYRVLAPGGCMAIIDNSPYSKVIQNMPPAIFALMKCTEPWSDQYFSTDIDQVARDFGFRNVKSVLCDPRHRVVTAFK
eukprot:TRINITY_DN32439_c0_g1_i1.p1 TRINITY_DN32439_c0_g1~~TRINITY_DN32439_c0_g1_i1.p1  ORF type:complete len:441 (+),score=56.69 TRINITY_DN32439_c0_g1_i1:72-1394(+)